jgi:hypothetical protein
MTTRTTFVGCFAEWPFLIMRRMALDSADPRQSLSLLIAASRA